MRSRFIYFVTIFAATLIFAACNAVDNSVNTNTKQPALGPETTYPDGARRITTAELEALLKDGQAVVVDVRNQDSFDRGHIPGSRLIPVSEILDRANELPRDKMIVTYCS